MDAAARQCPLGKDWRETAIAQVERSLQLMLEEKTFFQRLYKEITRTDYASAYLRIQRYVQFHLLHLIKLNSVNFDDEAGFCIVFWVCGANNAVSTWTTGGMKEPPLFIAEQVVACVPPHLAEMLDKSTAAKK